MKKTLLAVLGTLLLAGCEGQKQPAAAVRNTDPQVLAQGRQVFKKNCAACHGDRAQATAGWERPGADGKYPPPPLDGSAHAWHHPAAQLKQTIQEGTLKLGGNMPAWKGRLSEADTEAVIAWFQSLWPDEIYAAWADIDRRARRGEAGH